MYHVAKPTAVCVVVVVVFFMANHLVIILRISTNFKLVVLLCVVWSFL